MLPLSLTDQLFLLLEKRQQPMHVGALLLFNYPEDYTSNYSTELFESLRAYKQPTDPYNLKLKFQRGRYFWAEDHEFDMEHHVRHSSLPKPGRIRELLTYVSAEHSNLMHRERPLWECHFIEGIEGNRFALYLKVHHAVTDGMSGIRSLTRFLTDNGALRGAPPVWAMEDQPRVKSFRKHQTRWQRYQAMATDAKQKLVSIPETLRHIKNELSASQSGDNSLFALKAPQTILNSRITGSRRYAAQSYDLARFKQIASAFDATLNDVVLAVCGSALRKYLISLNALPNEPLIAMVPVSMRRDSSEGGNQIAMLQASLGTDVSDPEIRMQAIKVSINAAKKRIQQMSKEEYMLYMSIALAPGAVHLATGLRPDWLPCNVLISNVPGPQQPMYWNGAELQGLYPISVPLDRVALNITLMSYNGQIDFGLTACRRSMPSMQRLLNYIEEGVNELERVIDPKIPKKTHVRVSSEAIVE